jgi:carbamoylphosphate synthase large subunit
MVPRVLVTGAGGPAGRSLAQQLLRRSIEVVGVDMGPVTLPGVVTEQVPAAADPTFAPALFAIAAHHDVDLIVPTVSEELPVLAARPEPRAARAEVAVATMRSVATANDKWRTYLVLESAGVGVARSMLPSEVSGSDAVAGRLGLPYLSKPRVGRGGRGVAVHHEVALGASSRFDDSTILQEFVPGTEYAPNVYLARDPYDDIVVVLEKIEVSQRAVGSPTGLRRVKTPDVALVARKAARSIGLSGAVDVDVRRRADGTPVVLGINARFGANSAHAPEILDMLLAEQLPTAITA